MPKWFWSMDRHSYLSIKFCYLTNYQLKLSVMPIYESSKSSCKLESNLISFGTLYSIHDQPDSLTWVTCDSILKNMAILVLWKSTDLLQKQENSYTVKKYKKYAQNSETIFIDHMNLKKRRIDQQHRGLLELEYRIYLKLFNNTFEPFCHRA